MVLARTFMMRSEGGRRTGDDETIMVARDRTIMLKGRTERGARPVPTGGGIGSGIGCSASVEVRRSEEWM